MRHQWWHGLPSCWSLLQFGNLDLQQDAETKSLLIGIIVGCWLCRINSVDSTPGFLKERLCQRFVWNERKKTRESKHCCLLKNKENSEFGKRPNVCHRDQQAAAAICLQCKLHMVFAKNPRKCRILTLRTNGDWTSMVCIGIWLVVHKLSISRLLWADEEGLLWQSCGLLRAPIEKVFKAELSNRRL